VCAEASTVLRAVAADFLSNSSCSEIRPHNCIRHIPRCVHYHVSSASSRKAILTKEEALNEENSLSCSAGIQRARASRREGRNVEQK
jgi:hypothetical protein